MVGKTFSSDANRFGYYSTDEQAFSFSEAGEYLVNTTLPIPRQTASYGWLRESGPQW